MKWKELDYELIESSGFLRSNALYCWCIVELDDIC